ncbi:MAG: DUF4124 domain-containing protein [Halioglobus sp.]
MAHFKTFATCLVTLALHNAAWAEIYETTDAQGNPEFTDSPPTENAEVIDLQQTNVVDAPQMQQQQQEQQSEPQMDAPEQAAVQENNTVIVNDGYNEDLEEGYLLHERRMEEANPEMPHEVGDFDTPVPREVDAAERGVPVDGERYPARQGEEYRR